MTIRERASFPESPRSLGWALLVLALLGAAAGCGSNASKCIKVSGIVTLDGVPLGGAKVTFYPSSGEGPALGVTDAAGKFDLMTFDLKTRQSMAGALPGEYKVTVEMVPASTGRNPLGGAGLEAAHMKKPKAEKGGDNPPNTTVLHPNYADPSKTPLTQVVPPQGPVELKLTKNAT